jgi:hypothetical protein
MAQGLEQKQQDQGLRYDLKRYKNILHVANLTPSRSNAHSSPDFDSSERDCRQKARVFPPGSFRFNNAVEIFLFAR